MVLYKRGNIYWVVISKDGKRHFLSTKTSDKKKAEQIYVQVLLKLTDQIDKKPYYTDITFTDFFKKHYLLWCYKRQESYEIKKYFLNVIPDWLKNLKLNQISLQETEKLQNYWIEKEYSIATCNKYLSILFVNPDTGKRYTSIKRSFHTAFKKAGIRDFHFHDLRHTFASQLVMNGIDLKTVQELLGHKDIKTTLLYAHLSQAHKKETVNKISNFVKTLKTQEKS